MQPVELTTLDTGVRLNFGEADGGRDTTEQRDQDTITAEIEKYVDVLQLEDATCKSADIALCRRRIERVLECDVMDEEAVRQLDVEVFSSVSLDWVKAKITRFI